jgi:hypothetical protein
MGAGKKQALRVTFDGQETKWEIPAEHSPIRWHHPPL